MQRIQKVQLKPQEGPEDVDGSQLSSSWMQKRKVQRAFMQAQKCEDPGRRISAKSHSVEVGAAQCGFQGMLQRSHGRIQRRGDARVHERRETVNRTREGK